MTEAEFREKITQALTEVVTGQQARPDLSWHIMLAIDEDPTFFYFYNKAIMTPHYTNRPELGLGFDLTEEQVQRLKASHIASDMKRDETNPGLLTYCSDCGSDVAKAADIICTMYGEVSGFNAYPEIDVFTDECSPFLKSYQEHGELPISIDFNLPQGADYSTLKKKVEEYNANAAKKGYDPITLDANTITGSIHFKAGQGGNIFSKSKNIFNDGFMAEDFHAILKLCLEANKK